MRVPSQFSAAAHQYSGGCQRGHFAYTLQTTRRSVSVAHRPTCQTLQVANETVNCPGCVTILLVERRDFTPLSEIRVDSNALIGGRACGRCHGYQRNRTANGPNDGARATGLFTYRVDDGRPHAQTSRCVPNASAPPRFANELTGFREGVGGHLGERLENGFGRRLRAPCCGAP